MLASFRPILQRCECMDIHPIHARDLHEPSRHAIKDLRRLVVRRIAVHHAAHPVPISRADGIPSPVGACQGSHGGARSGRLKAEDLLGLICTDERPYPEKTVAIDPTELVPIRRPLSDAAAVSPL